MCSISRSYSTGITTYSIFTLTESEVYVHVGSVFYCDIDITERMEEGGTTVVLTDHDINHIHEQLTSFLYPCIG